MLQVQQLMSIEINNGAIKAAMALLERLKRMRWAATRANSEGGVAPALAALGITAGTMRRKKSTPRRETLVERIGRRIAAGLDPDAPEGEELASAAVGQGNDDQAVHAPAQPTKGDTVTAGPGTLPPAGTAGKRQTPQPPSKAVPRRRYAPAPPAASEKRGKVVVPRLPLLQPPQAY